MASPPGAAMDALPNDSRTKESARVNREADEHARSRYDGTHRPEQVGRPREVETGRAGETLSYVFRVPDPSTSLHCLD